MSSLNKCIILGRVGKQPEVRTLDNGTVVANFSVATSERYKDKAGEKQEKTEWHNIVVWRKPAEIVQKYVNKGDQILIEGKLTTRSWEKDGITRYSTEIVADNLTLLGGKKNNDSGSSQNEPAYASTANYGASSSDDLPF